MSGLHPLAAPVTVVLTCRDEEQHRRLPEAVPTAEACGPHRAEVIVVCRGRRGHRGVPEDARQMRVGRLSRARRMGLAAARSEFVILSDPSCRLLPGALAAGVDALAAHRRCGFVFGRSRPAVGDGPAYEEDLGTRAVHVDHYVELLRGDYIRTSAATMFRRSTALAAVEACDYGLYLEAARIAPVHYHGAVVAERTSAASRPGPAAGVIADFAALRRQYPRVRKDPHSLAAYREGAARLVARHAIRIGNHLRGRDARGFRRYFGGLFATVMLMGATLRMPQGVLSAFLQSELMPWLARRPASGGRGMRLMTSPHDVVGRHPVRAVADSVRATVPPDAMLFVLGDADPDLDLSDRRVEYLSADPVIHSGRPAAGDFVVVPSHSRWAVANRYPQLRDYLRSRCTTRWTGPDCLIAEVDGPEKRPEVRVLVAGYFSFVGGHATAGDTLTRDLVCQWLDDLGHPYEIAHAPPFTGGVDWRTAAPDRYSHVVFVCGPFAPWLGSGELLERFARARCIGVNLSMLARLDRWNPFDVLVERDSSRIARADLAFATAGDRVPVIGLCLREHADGTRTADGAIRRVLAREHAAVVPIDTRLDDMRNGQNSTGQRTAAEIEAIIARVDVVVTTRLHGLVLALKNEVPVVAVDPANEGSKICKQARSVDWPVAFNVTDLTDDRLRDALRYCLTEEARQQARRCAATGRATAAEVRAQFLAAFPAARA